MRIVAYVHFMMPHHFAGSEVMIHNLLKVAQAQGHDTYIVATYETEDAWVYDGVQCYGVTTERTGFGTLEWLRPDIILTHHHEVPAAISYGKYLNVPVSLIMHNNNQHRGHTNPLMDFGPNHVIYNTEWVREWYVSNYDIPNVVVHPPVFPEQHRTVSGDKVTIINLNKDKGSAIFYELADRMPHVEFLGVEGGHGTQNFEMRDNVTFQMQTTDMKNDVWAKTRILLVPSIYESYGMVGVEALCSGIPVIAAPTPGLKESLGFAGTFVERDDIDGWVEAIQFFLDSDQGYFEASEDSLKRVAEIDPYNEACVALVELERLVTEWHTPQ